MDDGTTRCDLHVHSAFSKRASIWLMQKLDCPESFTAPEAAYEIARQRGMTLVTITDHNTIDGALEIADRPGTFLSEEVTTYFPSDRCKIHVLVYNITEAQHREIHEVRENIFELLPYLDGAGIHYAVAHPLAAVNNRLDVAHFEQLLLLFRVFELNGDHDGGVNDCLADLLGRLTPADIERLAARYGIEPAFPEPWRKVLIGGSDDHSSLGIARTHTDVVGDCTPEEYLAAVFQGCGRVVNASSTPRAMAHAIYGIMFQYYKKRLGLGRHIHKDVLLRFLNRSLQSEAAEPPERLLDRLVRRIRTRRRGQVDLSAGASVVEILRHEAQSMVQNDEELKGLVQSAPAAGEPLPKAWFGFANSVSNKMLNHFANHLFERFANAQLFDLFHSLGSAGALYALLAPYFVSFSIYTAERRFARKVDARFPRPQGDPGAEAAPLKLAHFTDSYFEVNGVARTLQQQLAAAQRRGRDMTILTCRYGEHTGGAGVRAFDPIGAYALPLYPEFRIFFPPFLEMLDHCYTRGYTLLHAATPGPFGLSALAISRILKIPIVGTYSTALPRYMRYLTEDPAIEHIGWQYMAWFYRQMDMVLVSSRDSAEELANRGLAREKIRVYPRGVDTHRFDPARGNGYYRERHGVETGVVLLYAGRVSREKNLALLADAFAELAAARKDVHLAVVGDGPYLPEMTKRLRGLPVTFTGMLEGEALAAAYASADAFVFPSDTDTFGNVVLEAQASGLPVIVSDAGGPRENVEAGVTGMVVPAGERGALVAAMRTLAEDAALRRQMGAAGRKAMLERSCEDAYERTWRIYEEMEAAGPSDETESAWPGAGMDLSAALAPDSRSMTSAAIS